VIVTSHVLRRCSERAITYDDIICSIENGEIIEEYPNDYPYPSALVLGSTVEKAVLHTVVGIGDEKLWIITAYFPKSAKWEADLKTRKAEK
jgi:hypothetical protein